MCSKHWGGIDVYYKKEEGRFLLQIKGKNVMHGSYNWTLTANYNEETLATALDHELVVKFAKEFMELYKVIYF